MKGGVVLMELHERVRELRKKHLKLSQTAFGEKLGVSRDVIKNIELNTLARPEQKLSLIKLMSKEFNVSEDWLLEGIEPMFIEPDTFNLDEFAKSHGATQTELDILKTYFEIDPDIRKHLIEHFKSNLFTNNNDLQVINSLVKPMAKSVKDSEATYIKSRSNTAQKTDSSASSITSVIDNSNVVNQ